LKALSGKEKRFCRDVNHVIAKALVNEPGVKVYVLEDLSGIRKKRKGKFLNKLIGNWPFYQLEQFLTYKAEASGIEVAFTDARYTSQKCSRCSYINRKNRYGSSFRCLRCGYEDHADLNAAKNIRNNYLLLKTEEQGSVSSPYVGGKDAYKPLGLS
jgi:IS605 OrfB family transposase